MSFQSLPRDPDGVLTGLIASCDEWQMAVAIDYALRKGIRPVLERIDWASFTNAGVGAEVISRYVLGEGRLLDHLPFPRTRFMRPTREVTMLSTLEKTIILKGTNLMDGIPGDELYPMAQVMEEERLNEGFALIREGDRGEYLYIVVTGEILIHVGKKEINRHGKGDHFGEMALLDDAPRSASATAMEETLLLKIGQDDFLEIMMDHHEVRKAVMRILNERFRQLTHRYAQIP